MSIAHASHITVWDINKEHSAYTGEIGGKRNWVILHGNKDFTLCFFNNIGMNSRTQNDPAYKETHKF